MVTILHAISRDCFVYVVNTNLSYSSTSPIFVCLVSPQSDGGSAITSHAVEVKSSTGEWNVVGIEADPSSFESLSSSSVNLQASPLSYTVANLLTGTQYAFRVRCRNSIGVRKRNV